MVTSGEGIAAETPVGMVLAVLGRGATRLFTEALEPTGLKPRHLAALAELRRGPLAQQALGEAVHTDPTQLVALLNELEASELISRRRDPSDRRRHIVELSVAGTKRLAEAEDRVAEAEERLLAGLDASDRASFTQMLAKLVANAGVSLSCSSVAEVTGDCDDALTV